MRAMWLIGGNLIREQRWLAFLLALYIVVMTAVIAHDGAHAARADVAFLVKQQAIYAVLFSALLALSALHNERKSRRILAVLSKSVTRAQYLAGLLLGVMVLIGSYCLLVFAAGAVLAGQLQIAVAQVGIVVLGAFVAALLAAAVSVLFSTFLPPIVATAATGLVLAVPAALEPVLGQRAELILPVYSIGMMITRSTFDVAWSVAGPSFLFALGEAVVVWMFAVAVFSLKDIAVAIE